MLIEVCLELLQLAFGMKEKCKIKICLDKKIKVNVQSEQNHSCIYSFSKYIFLVSSRCTMLVIQELIK